MCFSYFPILKMLHSRSPYSDKHVSANHTRAKHACAKHVARGAGARYLVGAHMFGAKVLDANILVANMPRSIMCRKDCYTHSIDMFYPQPKCLINYSIIYLPNLHFKYNL